MAFAEAFAHLSKEEQDSLLKLLADWQTSSSLHKQAAENLKNEHASADNALAAYMRGLISRLHELQPTNKIIAKAFEEIGGTFALQGIPADCYKTALFGRAITVVKFCRYLARQLESLGIYDSEEDIRDTLHRLNGLDEESAPPPFRPYFEALRATQLGPPVTFATFAIPFNPDTRPWRTESAETVRASLALGADPLNHDYVLFTYRLPGDVVPRVPTTASPGWSYQLWFRPNVEATKDFHGFTHPMNTAFAVRAEIVHASLNGATLVFPLQIASV